MQIAFSSFGGKPEPGFNNAEPAGRLCEFLAGKTEKIEVLFEPGVYHFYPEQIAERPYYISNHDQLKRRVAFPLENLKHVTLNGNGAEIRVHASMISFALIQTEHCELKNFVLDSEYPTIRQLVVRERSGDDYLCEVFPPTPYRIENGELLFTGDKPFTVRNYSMPFNPDGVLVYRRADPIFNPERVEEVAPNQLRVVNWKADLPVGTFCALRRLGRPSPGIFLSHSSHTALKNITIHFSDGMGILAQLCDSVTLDSLHVKRRSDNDPRRHTTQADATHFSGCKGLIRSENGFYEGMADDAINVHGTYLRILRRLDDRTLTAAYQHEQAWGFDWGFAGDRVKLLCSDTMNTLTEALVIESISPVCADGCKEFTIRFTTPLPELEPGRKYGLENLSWSPDVIFRGNLIRRNRARGALFSTPGFVLCSENEFDHVHGCAIVLCGDCNEWFETGSCRNVRIENNLFRNVLMAPYQFCDAVISIHPVLPEPSANGFHSGIVICGNRFEVFDAPILYAKSVDGLLFSGNTISRNTEYPPYHPNREEIKLEDTLHADIRL